jgi:hypothetical protein
MLKFMRSAIMEGGQDEDARFGEFLMDQQDAF